jgi:uncharacterized iron-regulated membrane protein
MILANLRRLRMATGKPIALIGVASLAWVILWLTPTPSYAGLLSQQIRRYGPTVPNGYTVRVEPQAATLSHSQRQPVQVTVEDTAGKRIDGVTVQFRASEGTIATDAHITQDGRVTGTFATGSNSDHPRTAFIVVTVENVEVTVFIDIVPAVFGR